MRQLITKLSLIGLISVGCYSSVLAIAEEPTGTTSKPVLCGILERAAGQAQVLNPTRTMMLPVLPHTAIPCGAWVSIGSAGGNLAIKTRNGYRIQFGAGTFAQVTDGMDQVVLFRGYLYAETEDDGNELTVLSPNARTRMGRGKVIVLYSQEKDETQTVCVSNKATLENRFVDHPRRVVAKQGEASSLSQKMLKTEPSVSKAVSVAALREKLSLLPLDESDRKEALYVAHERGERLFPEFPGSADTERAPASEIKRSIASYEAHPEQKSNLNRKLTEHFKGRVLAGIASPGLLYPNGMMGVGRHGKLSLQDPAAMMRQRQASEEQREKQRLLKELKAIRPEEGE